MKKNKKVTINTTFHVINCIMIFIVAELLKKYVLSNTMIF